MTKQEYIQIGRDSMKHNHNMQLYARQKRMQKRLTKMLEQAANDLVAALTELAEAFRKAAEKMRVVKMKYSDLYVSQMPTNVTWECPHCGMENELSYTEFCAEYGEPYDWEYTKATCPRCGETYCLGNQEWE